LLQLQPIGRFNRIGLAALYRREVMRSLKFGVETLLAPMMNVGLWAIVFLVALPAEWTDAERYAKLQYVVIGLIAFTSAVTAADGLIFSIMFDRLEHGIQDLLMAPLSSLELVLAWTASGMTNALATAVVLVIPASLLLPLPWPAPWLAVAAIVMGAGCFAAIGILVGMWAEKWDHVGAAIGFVLVPMGYLSGAFAPVDALPGPVAAVIRWNPFAHAIDLFRHGVTGGGTMHPALSLVYLAVAWVALALAAAYRVRTSAKLRA
jgi:ABC-2 type transport system permease protein